MSPFSEVLDLHITEEPVRARDVGECEQVRPAGWHGYLATLGVEPLMDGLVRVLWRCDAGDEPPEAFTVFAADEWLAVSR